MSDGPAARHEMAYAVHTRTCTYLLDEDGVCRWIVSSRGLVPPHIQRCIGAQFVACLDLTAEGGLIGELRVGARALFVRHTGENMVMLRTGDIEHVDDRRAALAEGLPPPPLDDGGDSYGKRRGVPYMAKPPPRFGVVRREGDEQTITVTVPTK